VFLFIFESIGTSELLLIGIIALIFLGPRKLPQIAKTIGKTMADFRSTANEFKATWEKEVDFEVEAEALRTGELPEPQTQTIARELQIHAPTADENSILAPSIKEINKDEFENLSALKPEVATAPTTEEAPLETNSLSDKRNWL
jgi:Tat protein translocase TatB subunit